MSGPTWLREAVVVCGDLAPDRATEPGGLAEAAHQRADETGPGGWVEATWAGGKARLRFDVDEASHLRRLVELCLPNPTAEALRRIPLSRIEAAVRAHSLLQLSLAAQLNSDVPADLGRFFDDPRFGDGVSEPKRYRLKRPAARRLDDAFFKQVARAYREAIIHGLKPRQVLARDTGAAADTVAGWIVEARKRGHLPPTQSGKATAPADQEGAVT